MLLRLVDISPRYVRITWITWVQVKGHQPGITTSNAFGWSPLGEQSLKLFTEEGCVEPQSLGTAIHRIALSSRDDETATNPGRERATTVRSLVLVALILYNFPGLSLFDGNWVNPV